MYFNPELIKARAANPDNLVIKHRNVSNRNSNPLNHEERVFLGTMAKLSGARETERAFGVSQAAISGFARGVSSFASGVNEKLRDDVEAATKDVSATISDKALTTLTKALGLVDDKLPNVGKATDLAKIAKDMSTIHSNMTAKNTPSGLNVGLQVVIHAPVQKRVRDFEIVND